MPARKTTKKTAKKTAKKTTKKTSKKTAKKATKTVAKKAAPKTAKKSAKKSAKKAAPMTAKKAAKKAAPKAAQKTAKRAPAPTTEAPAAPESTSAAPAAGDTAPAFSLPGNDGATHSLAEHAGKPVILYFYPKDDTPGCTVEACGFRDNIGRAAAKGATVYGVSRDSLASHDKFKAKYDLNFTLLSDADLAVHKAYGAWGHKVMYGKPVEGVIRSTFLIGPNGKVVKAWPKVKVEGHVDDVLAALEVM